MYRRCSNTSADVRLRRRDTVKAMEAARQPAPPIIRISPTIARSTWAGFQVTANAKIAPTIMSAILPPIVTEKPPPFAAYSPLAAYSPGTGRR